jgi:hypothetical protein
MILLDTLLRYRELYRETVISSAPSLQGHRTIKIQFSAPIHRNHTRFLIKQNLGKLRETTSVNESLIADLYSKGIIDLEFKKALVSFEFLNATFKAFLLIFYSRWHFVQELLHTSNEKSTRLYIHCLHFTASEQFKLFLDALEYSGNLPAILILDPSRLINPAVGVSQTGGTDTRTLMEPVNELVTIHCN